MTPEQLLQCLNTAVASGVIDNTNLPGVGVFLARLGQSSMPIDGGRAELITGGASLVSTATYRSVSWTLTLTALADPDRFSIALTLPPGVTSIALGTLFPVLPQSWLPSGDFGLILTDSVLAKIVLEKASFAADDTHPDPVAELTGTLLLSDGALAQYIDYFKAERLACSGSVDFKDTEHPLIKVRAVAPNAPLGAPITGRAEASSSLDLSSSGILLKSHDTNQYQSEPEFVSTVLLYGAVTLPFPEHPEVLITAPLAQRNYQWVASATIDDPLTIEKAVRLFGWLFPGLPVADFQLPSGLAPLNKFGLSALEFGFKPPPGLSGFPSIAHTSVTLRSVTGWDTPLAFVQVAELGTQWMAVWSKETLVRGIIFGTLRFGAKAPPGAGMQSSILDAQGKPVDLDISVSLPELQIEAKTRGEIALPFLDAFAAYFAQPNPNVPSALSVTNIHILASIPDKTYSGWLDVKGNWPIQVGTVSFLLDSILFKMSVSPNSVSGSVTGTVGVQAGSSTRFTLSASAEYTGKGTWTFAGGLSSGTIDLNAFVWGLMGSEPPSWLPTVQLTELWAQYSTDTANGSPYSGRAALVGRWTPNDALGITLSLTARASIERKKKSAPADHALALAMPHLADANTITSGALSGTFELNRLAITLGLSFAGAEKTYLFRLKYRELMLEATTAWVGDAGERRQILNITLVNVKLGDIVRFFAGLANPNMNFRLEPPWTFLDSIDLSRFTLVLDPQKQSIELRLRMGISLPFLSMDEIGLVYDRSNGTPSVRFRVYGNFLGQDYRQKPLEWNALEDAPPSVPGSGSQLLDLRYLGLGQHIRLRNLNDPDSVSQVIETMEADMLPVTDPKKNPLTAAVAFDPANRWTIAADVTFMSTVTLQLVLRDPDLYAILIALGGSEAGSLSGLSFELLYKKVSRDIGVFHVRFQAPDAFRQLFFGPVSITLGPVVVDIFTNGNFLVDLGFPHNRDFSQSFGLEAGVFLGRGGIYFGVLNGETSKRVPQVTNGNFDPVLELGLGFIVGIGRTFNTGPLKAGLYVAVEVIFEGVLAWFHPDNSGASIALYYQCRGTAGITGKLYGAVDFKIIRVDVTVEAYALVTLSFTAYEVTFVELNVGVRVHASIKIFFISISFSFGLTINAQFTIGSPSRTPWILADGNAPSTRTMPRAQGNRRHALLLVPAATRAEMRLRRGLAAVSDQDRSYNLVWNENLHVFPDSLPRAVRLTLLPSFTVADIPVDWSGSVVPPNPDPAWRMAFVVSTDSGIVPDAPSIRATHKLQAHRSATANSSDELGFPTLIDAMIRWSISALGIDPVRGIVTSGALEELAAQMELPQTAASGFTRAKLEGFFSTNLHFTMTGIPSGEPGADGGTVFPLFPILRWTWYEPQGEPQNRDFGSYCTVDAIWEAEIGAYFSKLSSGAAGNPAQAEAGKDLDRESAASYVFRDYFLMIAKAAVQSALEAVRTYPCTFDGSQTLADMARQFHTETVSYLVHAGDTVEQVATAYALTAGELIWLDPALPQRLAATTPGSMLSVTLGVTPQSLAMANPLWPVVAKKTIMLGVATAQVGVVDGHPETLAAIAQRFGVTVDAWLADAAVLATERMLHPSAPLAFAARVFANPSLLPLNAIASVFFVRLPMSEAIPLSDWYAQAIASLNSTTIDEQGNITGPLIVPAQYNQYELTTTWNPLPGDTLSWVASYCALQQNGAAVPDYTNYLQSLIALNPNPGATVNIPAGTAVVRERETLASLATRLLYDLADSAQATAFHALVASANILEQLAQVAVPGAQVSTIDVDTLTSVSERVDLPLEQFGALIASLPGILATEAGSTPQAVATPALSVAQIVAYVLSGAHAATIAGQVSRFLLHGLRVPAPVKSDTGDTYHATGPLTGFAELLGTQIQAPAPNPQLPPETLRLTLQVDSTQAVDWLTFATSAALAEGESTLPHERLNPSVAARARSGMVVLTANAESLDFAIQEKQLEDGCPDSGLKPAVVSAPAALNVARVLPVRHALDQFTRWQTTEAVVLPNGGNILTGMPGIWSFSSDLNTIAQRNLATPYALFRVDTASATQEPIAVTTWAWGTLLCFSIHRIPGYPDLCEIFGAAPTDRATLLALWQALANQSGALSVLYSLPASAGLPPGLTSTAMNCTATYVVKTNLSTETHSGVRSVRAQDEEPLYFAALDQPSAFLQLLWEASVVGGSGFWLRFVAADGSSLPDAIYDQAGRASLSLLALLDAQMKTSPQRRLYPFTNCAVIGPGMDASASAVFVQAADGSENSVAASVNPGEIGFTFSLDRATDGSAADAQQRLRQEYSLLGYRMEENAAFAGSNVGLPVGPQTTPGQDGAEDNEDVWRLERVIPAVRFAKNRAATPPFPPASDNVYAGIGQSASVQLCFTDVFGNCSAENSSADGALSLPLLYTDELAGVANWPGTAVSYAVESVPAPAQGAALRAALYLQTSAFLPGATTDADSAAAAAVEQRERFSRIAWQLAQADISATLLTTLQQAKGVQPLPLDDPDQSLLRMLRAYANAGYVWLGAAASQLSICADPAATPTLAALLANTGVDADALAAANAARTVTELIGSDPIHVPQFVVTQTDRSVQAICPSGIDPSVVLAFAENLVLPMQVGTEIAIARQQTMADSAQSLRQIALAAKCSPAALVQSNRSTSGLLQPGFIFTCEGVRVAVGTESPQSETTLDLVAQAFAHAGVPFDAVMVAMANADLPGMFRSTALAVDGYTILPGDTLGSNQSGQSGAALGALNIAVANLFPAGTPLFAASSMDSNTKQRLGEMARVHGVTAGDLIRSNLDRTPTCDLTLPARSELPNGGSATYLPYWIQSTDTLSNLAARTVPGVGASPLLALATANAALPILAPNIVVNIGGQSVTTAPGDTLDSLCEKFNPPVTLEELAAVVGTQRPFLSSGSLMVVTPAQVPKSAACTPAAIAESFAVPVSSILAANTATADLVVPFMRLYADVDRAASIVTAADDTLASVIRRFAVVQGVDTTCANLAAANKDVAFLRAGATVLLPLITSLALPLSANGTWTFPDTIFAIQTWIELRRSFTLADPALRGTEQTPSSVVRNRAALPALRTPSESSGNALTLLQFADTLQAAIPRLRLATARTTSSSGENQSDVWAIDFGPSGISQVEVAPSVDLPGVAGKQPRCYALRPLATQLLSRSGVPISIFDPQDGKLHPAGTRDYQAVDLEPWALSFLADVDLFCTASYSTGAKRANAPQLANLLTTKIELAGAIANGLEIVEQNSGAVPDAARAQAWQTLRQQLLRSLVDGYGIDSIAQYDATIQSPWGGDSARFAGAARFTSDPKLGDLTVGAAKISLAAGANYLSLLFDTAQAARLRVACPELSFTINELEFDVQSVEGYESSQWLSFVLPLRDAPGMSIDFGHPRIPLPLRGYPMLPSLVTQQASGAADPQSIADACQWTYRFTYEHQSTAQETIGFCLDVNLQAGTQLAANTADVDLFAALAQYSEVRESLWTVLGQLTNGSEIPADSPLSEAVATLAGLVQCVADAWEAHWQLATEAVAVNAETREYTVTLSTQGELYDKLCLEQVAGAAVAAPQITCITPDGIRVALNPLSLSTEGGTWLQTYKFSADVPAFARLQFEYAFGSLPVAIFENARTRVWVTRNAQLLDLPAPPTQQSFHYRTPEIAFPDPTVPSLIYTRVFPIGQWTSDAATSPLNQVFATVLPSGVGAISFALLYGYDLAPSLQAETTISTYLPVAFCPITPFAASTVADIIAAIEAWKLKYAPNKTGGRWVVDLTCYSALSQTRPLLRLAHISASIACASPPRLL